MGTVRTLIFHGYLLRGTGSNIYNASLAKALTKLGHEVHLLCQDAQAGELDFVDAVGRWEGGELRIETLREPVQCTAYLPDIGEVLPVYVADEYEGFRAVRFADLTDDEPRPATSPPTWRPCARWRSGRRPRWRSRTTS